MATLFFVPKRSRLPLRLTKCTTIVSLSRLLVQRFTTLAQKFWWQLLVRVTTLMAPGPGVLATELVGSRWKTTLFRRVAQLLGRALYTLESARRTGFPPARRWLTQWQEAILMRLEITSRLPCTRLMTAVRLVVLPALRTKSRLVLGRAVLTAFPTGKDPTPFPLTWIKTLGEK